MKRRFILPALAGAALLLGAGWDHSRPDAVWAYGTPGATQGLGVEAQWGEVGCGLEVWPQPGPFCNHGDPVG